VSGFSAQAVYLDDAGRAIGARFHHQRSGFTLDLLQIQSVPQAFFWVTTYPTSNMGEPHTQEHLLVGKGSKGRALGSRESMSLVESNAFTQQWETCYDFYSTAGSEVFYRNFEDTLDALLHPDYSDEEIRREVRNFGVVTNPQNGEQHLEEKGSVYNEMSTSMDQAGARLFQDAKTLIFGPEHPYAFSSGGLPAALRVLKPEDIRRFHAQHYFLANMGAIASLPKEMAPGDALARFDALLNRMEKTPPSLPVMTEDKLPAPRPAPAGKIEIVEYPFRNEKQPGYVGLAWPPDRKLNYRDNQLLSLFMQTVASEAGSNLYRRLVDSTTRDKDYGATDVGAFVDDDHGNAVFVFLNDVAVSHMNDAELAEIRAKVMDELGRVAAYPDGSTELKAFAERYEGRIVELRRSLAKLVNSPPGFGFRGGSGFWNSHLYQINREPGFRKSLTVKDDLDALEKLVSGDKNIWREYLAQWKITGVQPYVVAAKPSAAVLAQEEKERTERGIAEAERLQRLYGTPDLASTIKHYQQEYDANSAALEKAAHDAAPPKFIDTPPMTLDDQLDFQTSKLAGVPLVTSRFESMTSATVGIALRVDGVPQDRLVFLSALPALLTRSGVIEDGKPVSFEQMTERLRKEILSLNATFSVNGVTDRYELVVRGSGNDLAESRRAVAWMNLVLYHPDWRLDNLPRLRDLVDQSLAGLRSTMQGAEEGWVRDVAQCYLKQGNPLYLATSSFLTRAHSLDRLRWMLKSGADEPFYAFMAGLAKTPGTREERKALLASIQSGKHPGLAKLTAAERALATDVAKDLDGLLPDLPDSSMAADWTYLCNEISHDVKMGPQWALGMLQEVRESVLRASGARMFYIGSSANSQSLTDGMTALAQGLDSKPITKVVYRDGLRLIDDRLKGREPAAAHPVFVGLLNANSQGGVFLNSAPLTSYHDTDRGKLFDYLAANLYGGGGAHSIFSKTIAAGLAYSNGIGAGLASGRVQYYAERTPLLPQTLQFVIGELQRAHPDGSLTEYAIAGAFRGTRSAASYESRGEGMAQDLADGLPPDLIRQFHQAILDLRTAPDLSDQLARRMTPVYAKVLPGLGEKVDAVAGGVYMVIGAEKQLSAYEAYLKQADGDGTRLWRLYPRDFWLLE